MAVAPQVAAHYRSLYDQINDGVYDKALKRVERVLAADSSDALAQSIKTKLLIALERYNDALSYIGASETLDKAYCLYKLGREDEALSVLASTGGGASEDDERAAQVLEAQIDYKMHKYAESQAIFEDLLLTADAPDSPEYADLQANLDMTSLLVQKESSAEQSLAYAQQDFTDLESFPIASLISKGHTAKAPRYISKKEIESQKKEDASELDPDRWLPKKQRASYLAELAKNKQTRRKKGKNAATALLSQGAGDVDSETQYSGVSTPIKANTNSNKKKKGKK